MVKNTILQVGMPPLYTSIYAPTLLQLLLFASSSSNGINLVYLTPLFFNWLFN
jgi:hypothetical protein